MKKRAGRSAVPANGATNADAARFKKAANNYGKRASSMRTARHMLVALGVYTKAGRLTKNYSR